MLMAEWRNWSGSVTARPEQIARPTTEAELAERVRAARKVRVVGAGHSFMPLCATEGLLLDLSALEGEIEVADDRVSVWAPAGMSLATLTERLWGLGLSLANQGDVNPQSLAGAISTGTHGTGEMLGSLATLALGFRIVTADGEVVECHAGLRPQLFQAARLSLGLLGVISRIRISVAPAFYLKQRLFGARLGEIRERFDEWAAINRHAEFFIFPYSDRAIVKILDTVLTPRRPDEIAKDVDENAFRLACGLSRALPFAIPALQKLMARVGGAPSETIGPAYEVYPSERTIPFEEMEYELPRAAGLETLGAVIDQIQKRKLPVVFPFEFRITAGDDIWLSPFNRGACASISMHQYGPMDWKAPFAAIEPIFRAAGGRPHWAKRHTLTAREVHDLYPRADDFERVRATIDPGAKFANRLMCDLFAIEARAGADA
jgi:FAD-linked oxidoreductase